MGVVFSGEEGLRHCKMCDSPELFPGEINPYGYCFGCSDGDEDFGKPPPEPPSNPPPPSRDYPNRHAPYWMRSGRHG